MTIEKGQPWGREVSRPADLRIARSDDDLAAALSDGSGTPTTIVGGDLHRTLGGPQLHDRGIVLELSLDLLEVTLDDGVARPAVAHVVARSPWWRGSWWRGPVLAVMNGEYLGDWDVAPRGHPNDGRAEAHLADPAFTVRDRWAARRRLPLGTHIPHPAITTRSFRGATWSFDRALTVVVDGRHVGRSTSVAVVVRPDAATIYV